MAGITNDWDIMLPEVRAIYPTKQALYDHHKENVPHFSEFEENHFKKFWDVAAPLLGTAYIKQFFSEQFARCVSEEDLISSPAYQLLKAMFGHEDSIEKLGNGQIKVSKGESYMVIDFVADEKGIRKPVIKETRYSSNPLSLSYLSPLIIWQRDKKTNQASYFCGQIPQEFMQSHPHLFSERHDTLLGQLVVSAYSPKARDQMPKEIKMRGTHGKEVTQALLEAQSVLLVPMYDQLFLRESPVILGLEKFATYS